MAVPSNRDDSSEPDAIEFGIAALENEIDSADLTFPADAEEILAAVGDPDVPYDPWGNSLPLSRALRVTDRTSFESRRDLLNALHPVFEAERESGGLRGWLRSLLPF